jgi:hypothetical protein
MFKVFFKKYPSFKLENKSDLDFVFLYKKKLPLELIQFFKEYGIGTYMDGFLKIINPNDFQDSLNEAYVNVNNKEIVFGVTAFGDYLVWGGDSIRLIKFRYGTSSIIENDDDMTWFFDMDLAEDGYVEDNFSIQNYQLAKEKLGKLSIDECYGYIPILAAGGTEKVENLQKVKIKEHIALISQFAGKIE